MYCITRSGCYKKSIPVVLILLLLLVPVLFAGYFPRLVTTAQKCKDSSISFLNDRAREITGAWAVNVPDLITLDGLTGEGQIVAIADSGLDSGNINDLHPDLRSLPGQAPKITGLNSLAGRNVPDDPNGHGTHMAATIAGTGAASTGKFKGMAPGASIYFQAILNNDGNPELPPDLNELFLPAYLAGARVHVDGWGSAGNGYGEPAAQIDGFVRSHPEFLVVLGAGNSGPDSGTVTSEANSKNVLTAGASILPRPALVPGPDDTSLPAGFSSRGPAGDGRIKPELLAPASAVISARSRLVEGNLPGYPDYTSMQGTSMAAAVAGGSSAILREYLMKRKDLPDPSAALMKAILINGARTADGGPSNEGFGVIDLAGTLVALKEKTFQVAEQQSGLAQGNSISYTYRVQDSGAPLKVTLAWSDPPANPGSPRALVNDLDLTVQAPNGKVFNGNNFLGNAPDKINNVEQVYLPEPAPGDYVIKVYGADIKQSVRAEASNPVQDFALVWGQPPAEDIVEKVEGNTLYLASGKSANISDYSIRNLVNDQLTAADPSNIYQGAAVFQTPRRIYLAARLWLASGVRPLKTAEGTVFTEINPAAKLGGYRLANNPAGTFTLNGKPAENLLESGGLPPGVEISAVINPQDQKLRQVSAAYDEREGVVSRVGAENGRRIIYLEEDRGRIYRISTDAAYSYSDSYVDSGIPDIPYGAGALEELGQVLPGMPVSLRLSPSSGEVQYLAVKRQLLTGTVKAINSSTGQITMENDTAWQMIRAGPVIRDKEQGSLSMIAPGDHILAVLHPVTKQIIGLVAFSRVYYGKVIDVTNQDRTLYCLDFDGVYNSFFLPAEAAIYRWGVKSTIDAVSTGSLVKVSAGREGNVVWLMDVTDAFREQNTMAGYDSETELLTTADGKQYRISAQTRFYKNSCPVLPEHILPGEQIAIEYAKGPLPAGNVLVSVSVNSPTPGPATLVSTLDLKDRLLITGRTGTNTAVNLWRNGVPAQAVHVDASGGFKFSLPGEAAGESGYTLVAVDRLTGGAARIDLRFGGSGATVTGDVYEIISRAGAEVLPGGVQGAYLPDQPLTRAQAAVTLSIFLNWPVESTWPLPFSDVDEFPVKSRAAVAEARARGIINGYPGGRFLPDNRLSRAEAAVILDGIMRELGISSVPEDAVPYADAAEIPLWAAGAVARTTAAGLFSGAPEGEFAPGAMFTAGDLASAMNKILDYWQIQPN
ncbi:MAG: Serine protease AprX [Pelotomaculum sp. PtaB.Bin104]|nr:MAG: Serine protease AprX [Pelotomaculum sp. PtaB.Bin104]